MPNHRNRELCTEALERAAQFEAEGNYPQAIKDYNLACALSQSVKVRQGCRTLAEFNERRMHSCSG